MTTDASGQTRQRGLGKGLAALLGESMEPAAGGARPGALLSIPIEHLAPHPGQPRQHFDEAEIESLAASIREKGVVQPLVVRPGPGGEDGAPYQIVAGERRWRAAQKAGIHELPAVVRALDDSESIEIALVENLQRRDLNPLEEATAYRRLIRDFDHRQEDVASALGKSRSHVANTVRLLDLPETVRALVGGGTLSAGHGRALLAAGDPAALAETVVRLAGSPCARPRRWCAARARPAAAGPGRARPIPTSRRCRTISAARSASRSHSTPLPAATEAASPSPTRRRSSSTRSSTACAQARHPAHPSRRFRGLSTSLHLIFQFVRVHILSLTCLAKQFGAILRPGATRGFRPNSLACAVLVGSISAERRAGGQAFPSSPRNNVRCTARGGRGRIAAWSAETSEFRPVA